jgi:hypothetical protein
VHTDVLYHSGQGGGIPKVSDTMLDLALKLRPVIVYVYTYIYEAGKEQWWTLERVVVGGGPLASRGAGDFFTTFFLGTPSRCLWLCRPYML